MRIIIDVLLSAGKEVTLWAFEGSWKVICNRKPATDIFLAKFEPRSDIFATVGKVTTVCLTFGSPIRSLIMNDSLIV